MQYFPRGTNIKAFWSEFWLKRFLNYFLVNRSKSYFMDFVFIERCINKIYILCGKVHKFDLAAERENPTISLG